MRLLAVAGLTLAALAASGADPSSGGTGGECAGPRAPAPYVRAVHRALESKRDLWGGRLVASPDGPTYAGAHAPLAPLLYALGPRGRPLTGSGVYYLPFAFPFEVGGARLYALHVADGSEIVRRRVGGPSLTIDVGPGGRERYGSCLARLVPARLGDGYLPILQTAYTDAAGVRYTQESFVGRLYGKVSVSFVHLTVDASAATAVAVVRLHPSTPGLHREGDGLVRAGATQLAFSDGGTFDGAAARYAVAPGQTLDVYAGWPLRATDRRIVVDQRGYDTARDVVSRFWDSLLAGGATYEVPEQRVVDAERALLIQELELVFRYSAGNTYEELSFAEASDVAQVMAEYGFADVAKTILRFSLARLPARFTNWRAGERLVAGATYQRLFRDRPYLDQETPRLARVVAALGREIGRRGGGGLLDREPYSSDIATEVYALHGQAVVWQGLEAMGRVWAGSGRPELAARCRRLAARLAHALHTAVRSSERRLADGSLYVPTALDERREPLGRTAVSRAGSYSNLVLPYALASGLFPPHGPTAHGALRYLFGHGARLLGLVRAGAGHLYGRETEPLAGTDEVYGLNVSRFLADNDQPDQLVLSLYGTLGAAMTPDTFVSGESANVAPLHGLLYRAMFQPPNAGGNATYLGTLRLLLVHETRGPAGAPRGLELAFATPRPWLEDGKTIAVTDAPTSFGPVSYSLERERGIVHVSVVPPAWRRPSTLKLRLRLPRGERVQAVRDAAGSLPFDPRSGTLDLSGLRGPAELEAIVGTQ